MKGFFIIFLISPILLCCESKSEVYQPSAAFHDQVNREIDSINNSTDLQSYLLKIQEYDQLPRQQENIVLENFGHGSEEYITIWDKINRTDIENKIRIDYLIKRMGHPKSNEVGFQASQVPILVIHHSAEYSDRVKYFSTFYDAYKRR